VAADIETGDAGMTVPADGALLAAVDALLMAAVGLTSRTLASSPARDLTVTQWRMLALLDDSDTGIRLTDLADATAMSLPSASRMVNRLVARGFARSEPDETDRRAVRITLTDEGRATVDDVLRRRHAAVAEALDGRSLSETFAHELRTLAATLAAVATGSRP
jgi:DNA-binding MarR family transcriptional regulator